MSRPGDGVSAEKDPASKSPPLHESGALGTILAVAAHELSNPMTGILAFARYAAERTDPTDRLHELLIDIEREALRCTSTIQDLLAFSRVSGLEEHAIATLPAVVERALEVLSDLASKHGIAIARELDLELPPVRVQPWSLHQALVNLLASAIDALIFARVPAPCIALRCTRDADLVCLTLVDNAPAPARLGAPPAFVRNGHALARAVVTTQGGSVAFQEHTEGLRVRVCLPIVRG